MIDPRPCPFRSETIYQNKTYSSEYDTDDDLKGLTWREFFKESVHYQDLCLNSYKTAYYKPNRLTWKQFYDEYLDGGDGGSEGEENSDEENSDSDEDGGAGGSSDEEPPFLCAY
jgi:hypothetical protein